MEYDRKQSGEGRMDSCGELFHMTGETLTCLTQRHTYTMMQSWLEMNQGPWGKSPRLIPSKEPMGHLVNWLQQAHYWTKHRWGMRKRKKEGLRHWVPGFETHSLEIIPRELFLGTGRGNWDLAWWITCKLTVRWRMTSFISLGLSFPISKIWGNYTTTSGRLLLPPVKVAQLYLTLCDPMDYRVHGILQARILEWVAFPFSRGSSQPRDWTQVSRIAGGFFYQLSHSGSPTPYEIKSLFSVFQEK